MSLGFHKGPGFQTGAMTGVAMQQGGARSSLTMQQQQQQQQQSNTMASMTLAAGEAVRMAKHVGTSLTTVSKDVYGFCTTGCMGTFFMTLFMFIQLVGAANLFFMGIYIYATTVDSICLYVPGVFGASKSIGGAPCPYGSMDLDDVAPAYLACGGAGIVYLFIKAAQYTFGLDTLTVENQTRAFCLDCLKYVALFLVALGNIEWSVVAVRISVTYYDDLYSTFDIPDILQFADSVGFSSFVYYFVFVTLVSAAVGMLIQLPNCTCFRVFANKAGADSIA